MKQYHKLLEDILERGTKKGDRTGTGAISLFGYQMRFNLQEGFPLVNTKPVWFKGIVVELLWFLRGDSNIKYLVDNGCNIWNEDSYNYYEKRCKKQGLVEYLDFEEFILSIKDFDNGYQSTYNLPDNYTLGDTGEQYPRLWRKWKAGNSPILESDSYSWSSSKSYKGMKQHYVDQIDELIYGLKNNPTSRRHILTAWNPATIADMALPACHSFVQFNCRPVTYNDVLPKFKERGYTKEQWVKDQETTTQFKYYLDCKFTMRSVDTMLGLPYNIASYALLTHIVGQICNMVPGQLIADLGDTHIYNNHIDAAREQLTRNPNKYPLPTLIIEQDGLAVLESIDGPQGYTLDDVIQELKWDMFGLENYQSYPKLENETKLNTGLR